GGEPDAGVVEDGGDRCPVGTGCRGGGEWEGCGDVGDGVGAGDVGGADLVGDVRGVEAGGRFGAGGGGAGAQGGEGGRGRGGAGGGRAWVGGGGGGHVGPAFCALARGGWMGRPGCCPGDTGRPGLVTAWSAVRL